MLSLMVVVVHPTRDLTAEFSNGRVAVEPDLFILQTAPQALDEDVVHPAPFAIHADSYVVGFEFSNLIRPSELAALVDEFEPELTLAEEGLFRVDDIEVFHDLQVFFAELGWGFPEAVSVDAQ